MAAEHGNEFWRRSAIKRTKQVWTISQALAKAIPIVANPTPTPPTKTPNLELPNRPAIIRTAEPTARQQKLWAEHHAITLQHRTTRRQPIEETTTHLQERPAPPPNVRHSPPPDRRAGRASRNNRRSGRAL